MGDLHPGSPSLKSLDECAANISVSHPTAFNMRHKLLSFLEDGELLEGVVEADEAYVLESKKMIPITIRNQRKHGKSETKCGLSDEQMCICVTADREGRVAARCVNWGKPHLREHPGSPQRTDWGEWCVPLRRNCGLQQAD